jgi:hypothetical protein
MGLDAVFHFLGFDPHLSTPADKAHSSWAAAYTALLGLDRPGGDGWPVNQHRRVAFNENRRKLSGVPNQFLKVLNN